MNYKKFKEELNVLDKLLLNIGVLKKLRVIIKIDLDPDVDVVPTDFREIDNNYFKNSWSYEYQFLSLTNFSFLKTRVYHIDHIIQLEDDLEIKLEQELMEDALNIANGINENLFSENGLNPRVNENFHLHKVRLLAIDNVKRKVFYDGSFMGNHEAYTMPDWDVFSKIEAIGIPTGLNNFYLELLGESFTLYTSGNYKIAYFVAYSALENYVNITLGSEEKEERFKDKLTKALKFHIEDLSRHEIYCGIINELEKFTLTRNIVAHGKNEIKIEEKECRSVLIFVSTIICAVQNKLSVFQDLYDKIA